MLSGLSHSVLIMNARHGLHGRARSPVRLSWFEASLKAYALFGLNHESTSPESIHSLVK